VKDNAGLRRYGLLRCFRRTVVADL
jgi:hypothetical protein